MPISLEQRMARLSPERRARVEARAAELVEQEMKLHDPSQAEFLAQMRVAEEIMQEDSELLRKLAGRD